MDDKPSTAMMRPLPDRPKYGWIAWEATAGYMSAHLSPDVTLKLSAYPGQDNSISWGASVTWAQEHEEANNFSTPHEALAQLWRVVDQSHSVFGMTEDSVKRPANYKENQWFDSWTAELMQRLVRVTHAVFKDDWMIVLVYRPVESMDGRIQARLMAVDNEVQVGGRGSSLGDGCRQLFHNAATVFTKYTGQR
jgi:hypothetical protein